MFNSNAPTLSDISALMNNNDGFGNSGSWWIILILIVLFGGWGNNGWGGNSGATDNYVLASDFSMLSRQLSDGFNSQERKLDSISNGICSLGYEQLGQFGNLGMNVMSGFNGIGTQVSNLGFELQNCCCTTQRAIDSVNYNMATQTNALQNTICSNTRDVIENQNASTRAILDFLTNDKIATLQAENQNLKLAASQTAQNSYLLSELKPCPIPAYITASPYQTYSYGCGCTGCN